MYFLLILSFHCITSSRLHCIYVCMVNYIHVSSVWKPEDTLYIWCVNYPIVKYLRHAWLHAWLKETKTAVKRHHYCQQMVAIIARCPSRKNMYGKACCICLFFHLVEHHLFFTVHNSMLSDTSRRPDSRDLFTNRFNRLYSRIYSVDGRPTVVFHCIQ